MSKLVFLDYVVKLRKEVEVVKHKGVTESNTKGWLVTVKHGDWVTSFWLPVGKRETLFKKLEQEMRLI